MRLNVGVLGAEERLRAGNSRALDDVNELAAAVVALPWIPFGVLVREHRTGRFENRAADEILRRDQLEAAVLARHLVSNRLSDFGVGFRQRSQDRECFCRHNLLYRSISPIGGAYLI